MYILSYVDGMLISFWGKLLISQIYTLKIGCQVNILESTFNFLPEIFTLQDSCFLFLFFYNLTTSTSEVELPYLIHNH